MKDSEFLNWVACRMVLVYGESPNVDFVHRARAVAANIEARESDLDRYAVSLENMEVLRAQVEDQAREIAALKAQPSGVVRWPEADEIMQMAFEEGQPGEDAGGYYFELEEFDLFIQRLMEEVARLNQPASAGAWLT